jgi:hypothetical protein
VLNAADVGGLLAISSSTGAVGLVNNGLGARTKNNCSTDGGLVEGTERLTIGLGSDLAGLQVDWAELDVEGKFDGALAATLLPGGATLSDPLANDSADNGPDSGTGDNNRVVIGSPGPGDDFTGITFAASSGGIAVDGGGDAEPYPVALRNSLGTDVSVFHLVGEQTFEYTVECGETAGGASEAEESVGGVAFTRLVNKGETDCATSTSKPIGVSIDVEPNSIVENGELRDVVVLDNTATSADGTPQAVQARVRIEWSVPRTIDGVPRDPADINLELEREIQYEGDVPKRLISYCASATGLVDLINDPGAVVHPDDEPWCLISDERTLVGDHIVQVLILDVGGDPKAF